MTSEKKKAVKEEQEFRKLLPTSGFFADYMTYTDLQESPGSFHFWVAATLLGACLQRNTWVHKGIYQVYPNLYTILVAPSGVCRKSRAISLGMSVVNDFAWLNVIADKTTPEALLDALMIGTSQMVNPSKKSHSQPKNSTGLVKSSELSVFLNKQTYNSGMVALLTDLYDCPDDHKYVTRNKGAVVLKNSAVQFLAGTTPRWLATSIPEDAFEGGFMSRVLFVVKHMRDRSIAFPKNPEVGTVRKLQEHILRARVTCRGAMKLEDTAHDWFETWYCTEEAIADDRFTAFVERKPDTTLKLGMILAAGEGKSIITLQHLLIALKIIEWTQSRAFKAFVHVDLSPMGHIRRKIIDYLDINGGRLTRRRILQRFAGQINGLQELSQVEATMIEARDIKIEKDRKTGGRPAIYYQRLRGGSHGE